jgi:hypothetical protein
MESTTRLLKQIVELLKNPPVITPPQQPTSLFDEIETLLQEEDKRLRKVYVSDADNAELGLGAPGK